MTRNILMAALACAALAGPTAADVIGTDLNDFAVYSGGHFGADADVRIDGRIGAGGRAHFGSGASATSDVYTASSFSSDRAVTIGGRIVARQGVSVDRDGSVGSIDAGGDVWVGRDSAVGGAIQGGGGVSLERGVRVGGHVAYNDAYWADASATINGSVTDNAGPDRWDALTLSNPGPATPSGQSQWYGSNSDESLAAGDFGSISTDRDVTLRLTAGQYNLASLWLGRDSRLIVDTSAGDVAINVAGAFSADRGLVIDNVGTGELVIQTGGNLSLNRDSLVEAQLLSFGGASIDRDSHIDGTLHALRDVWLDRGVTVTGVGAGAASHAAVPEPATLALFLASGACLLRRPRRQAA